MARARGPLEHAGPPFGRSPSPVRLAPREALVQRLHGVAANVVAPQRVRPGDGRVQRGALARRARLRLAEWTSKPGRSDLTVLAATARQGTPSLTAFRARDGAELWSCGLGSPLVQFPQLFEVANGSLAVMGGAGTCGPCDPPYADSHATFMDFAVPGLAPAFAPWIGTFGGPGHDHLEDASFNK